MQTVVLGAFFLVLLAAGLGLGALASDDERRQKVLGTSAVSIVVVTIVLGMSVVWFRPEVCELLGGDDRNGNCVGGWADAENRNAPQP